MEGHSELIEALGGGTKVAEALSEMTGKPVDREVVYKFKVNGVPWKWRPYVADLARQRGVKLPEGFFPLDNFSESQGGARAEPTAEDAA